MECLKILERESKNKTERILLLSPEAISHLFQLTIFEHVTPIEHIPFEYHILLLKVDLNLHASRIPEVNS